MKLVQLDIQTLPGIQPGFRVDAFSSGTNLMIAPNAGGKSSLLRALNFLIAGVRPGDPAALSLAAVFEEAGVRWTVRRTGSSIVWERNGQPAEGPPLPASDQLHCYWFSMEDLLSSDARDESLLLELRRILSGGFDPDAVTREPGFSVGPRHGIAQAAALNDAMRKRRAIEADYRTLHAEESRLPELENKLRDAEAAALTAAALTQALSLMDAGDARIRTEAGLQTFPPNMVLLRGNEAARLEDLERKQQTLLSERRDCQSALDAAEQMLRETALADGAPEEAALDACFQDLEEIRSMQEQKKSAIEKLAEAGSELQRTLRQLGGNSVPPALDPGAISEAETLALRIQQLLRECEEIRARMASAPPAPDSRETGRLTMGVEALRGWLSAGSASLLLPGLAACFALAAAIAGFFAGAWIACALAGIALILIVCTFRPGAATEYRKRFLESGLPGPVEWTVERVRERLDEMEMRRAEMREDEVRARHARDCAQSLAALEPALAEAEARKAAMAERLGFDPGITASGLDRLVRLISEYENAVRENDAAHAAIARLDGEISHSSGRIVSFLESWKAAPAADDIASALQSLRSRARAAANAQHGIATAMREISGLEKQLSDIGDERASLIRGAGIADGNVAALARCCEQFEAWKQQNAQLQEAKVLEAERRRPLEKNHDLLARVDAGLRADLETDLTGAESLARLAPDLREEITRIKTRRDGAGREAELERAGAAEQAAREALEDALDKALFSDAAHFLMDGVRNEYRSTHEPELLTSAREQFSRFTHHAFRLDVDVTHGWMAFDTRQQASRKLDELSSGTRMQLLLAMRLAWTRRIEQRSVTLPIFLDEALTTSDENRFAQVAQSLEELAQEESRQIIYLSARRHDVALWERAAGRPPHVIDLASIRFGSISASPEDYLVAPVESLPPPGLQSPEEYAAALGIPPVDPRGGSGAVPVFHILRDDLPLLHRLMEEWSIQSVGQLRSLLNSEAAEHALKDADLRSRLSGRCRVTEAWIDAWLQGRGRPVDRIALEESGTVSHIFLDQASVLASEMNGGAAAVIGALKQKAIKGFRATSIDQLERWLQDHGYLDPAPVLEPEERERLVLERAAGAAPADARQVLRWLEAGGRFDQNRITISGVK